MDQHTHGSGAAGVDCQHCPERADQVAAYDLTARYGQLVDERRWDLFDQVLTPDVVFDSRRLGSDRTDSIEALVSRWSAPDFVHLAAHHATNVVLRRAMSGQQWTQCKGILVLNDGSVRSIVYLELLRRTDAGLRSSVRICRPVRPSPPGRTALADWCLGAPETAGADPGEPRWISLFDPDRLPSSAEQA
jgi:hypothetical protein